MSTQYAVLVTFADGNTKTLEAGESLEDAKRLQANARRRKGVTQADVTQVGTTSEVEAETVEVTTGAEVEAGEEVTGGQPGIAEDVGEKQEPTETTESETTEAAEAPVETPKLPTIEKGSGMYLDDEGNVWISFSAVSERLGTRYQQAFQRMKQGRLIARRYSSATVKSQWQARLDSVEEWETARNTYMENKTRRAAERAEEADAEPVELEVIEEEAEEQESEE